MTRERLEEIAARHTPSKHPFFAALSSCRHEVISEPRRLGELLHRYQAGMHATRTMAYALPCLDSPALRIRKLQILVDDDGLSGGDTHHHQLTRAFVKLGAAPRMADDEYGDLRTLETQVDAKTARFVGAVHRLYPSTLGAWAIVEVLSDDWMRAIAKGLAAHFPSILREPYFADCFEGHVEERHGLEALNLVDVVCGRTPELAAPTLRDAEEMADELTRFWGALHEVLQ